MLKVEVMFDSLDGSISKRPMWEHIYLIGRIKETRTR